MNESAVEWFAKQVLRSRQLGFISNEKFNELLYQAKEMEKEQIIKATLYGFRQDSDGDDWEGDNYNAEQYYNETFKQ